MFFAIFAHGTQVFVFADAFILIGNQPFCTRFFCENSSPIPHRNEAPVTPRMDEKITFSIRNAQLMHTMPMSR